MIDVLLSAWLSLAQQTAPSAAAVQALTARPGTDAQLITIAREQSDTLREALAQTLRAAALQRSPAEKVATLNSARRLARAYAIAWRDPFFVRQITRFEQASPARQRAKLAADSLRKAGNVALGQRGVPAAMRLWRASLQMATAAGDSAAQAAALGNVGAGFYRAGKLDSAETYLKRSRQLSTAIGDLRATANATGILASVIKDRGELARAADLYTAASALRERSGDSRGLAADQNNLGLIARELGDLTAATRAFARALALNKSAGRSAATALNVMNLAGVASVSGEYARADAFYAQALELQRRGGDHAEVPFVLHERGLLRIRRGDYAGADADLRAALQAHEAAGADLDAAAVRLDLASILMAAGDPQSALAMLRLAENQARAGDADDTLLGDMALAHADMAAHLNAFEEAHQHYATAENLYRSQGEDFRLGEVAEGRALLAYQRANYAESLAALQAAQRAYVRAQDGRAVALVQMSMSYTNMQLGDTASARRLALEAARALRRLDDPVGQAAALLALGDIELERQLPVAAEKQYRTALQTLADRPAADVRWRLHAGLGAALRAQRKLAPAVAQLRAAAVVIERSSKTLVADERKVGFMADKLDVFAQLALAERARGNVAAAFAASERMRAQQLLTLVTRSRVTRPHPKTAREQDLRRQIAELMGSVESEARAGRGSREAETRANASAREALYGAERAYARLLTELREEDRAYAAIVDPVHASTTDVMRRLARDEVLVEYLVTDSTLLAFVITNRRASLVDLSVARQTLAPLIDFSVRVAQRHDRPDANPLWEAPLARLHDYLIAPLVAGGYLAGKRALIIVPHAELHFVPFAALVDRQQHSFLVNRWTVSYASSASVWTNLRARPWKRRGSVVALAPRTDVLPFSRAEVAMIKQIYGRKASAFVGSSASLKTLRAALPNASIIHLATLGVLNKHNPLFSFVDLGRAQGERERLEVHEVFELPLNGQLVILSACQTALGSGALADVPAGDDWTGLVQSFLGAGAGGVIASLWAVNDQATADLMGNFHKRIHAGAGAPEALAQAQRAAIRNPATAHPFFWAAFTVHSGT
jgi:CHAT domain-containing protein/tetratricopeptide (TPR) repeat protein